MAVERAAFLQKLRKGLAFMINRRSALAFSTWLFMLDRAQRQAAGAGSPAPGKGGSIQLLKSKPGARAPSHDFNPLQVK
mgnify:CR=1 FL=1